MPLLHMSLQVSPLYTSHDSTRVITLHVSRFYTCRHSTHVTILHASPSVTIIHVSLCICRILRGASESILQSVWLQEMQKVVDGRRSSYPWTSAEINELRNKGHVKGYNYTLVRSSQLYPELAYSPANIRLTKMLPL